MTNIPFTKILEKVKEKESLIDQERIIEAFNKLGIDLNNMKTLNELIDILADKWEKL